MACQIPRSASCVMTSIGTIVIAMRYMWKENVFKATHVFTGGAEGGWTFSSEILSFSIASHDAARLPNNPSEHLTHISRPTHLEEGAHLFLLALS